MEAERPDAGDPEMAEPEAVVVEITDVIDLHSFLPGDVRDVVRDYLDAADERGLREVRIIHGRGIGVQRRSVREILAADPRVEAFVDAPAESGGTGATLVSFVRAGDGDGTPREG
jgi:DNA-nicking Smr family endonuclease